MSKIKFHHFLKSDNTTTNKALIPAYQIGGEVYDDIDLELTIINDDIQIDIHNKQSLIGPFFSATDADSVENELRKIADFNSSYEFADFTDINDGSELILIGDKQSSVATMISSQQNLNNINNVMTALKNHK